MLLIIIDMQKVGERLGSRHRTGHADQRAGIKNARFITLPDASHVIAWQDMANISEPSRQGRANGTQGAWILRGIAIGAVAIMQVEWAQGRSNTRAEASQENDDHVVGANHAISWE